MISVSAECSKLVRTLLSYARERREEGIHDFTEILSCFYRDVLTTRDSDDVSSRGLYHKRFIKQMKEFIETDPRYQSKMDEFARV